MVDLKEEAKKEKFIETMPTMIQKHLITCKDWAAVKDTAKSLKHIILKCDPPTPVMPMMATGATVLGLYSHIAHSVDKERVKYPNHSKALNRNKPEVEENLKENLRSKDKTHQKPKRLMKPVCMRTLMITITMPQARVKAADLVMVKAVTDNLEGLYNKTADKDLSMVNISFKVIAIREAHLNRTIRNMVIPTNPISREIIQIAIEAEAGAVDLSNSEDAAVEGPIIRIAMEGISISITHMTHNQNNMALPAVYAVDLIIPLSIATRENTT